MKVIMALLAILSFGALAYAESPNYYLRGEKETNIIFKESKSKFYEDLIAKGNSKPKKFSVCVNDDKWIPSALNFAIHSQETPVFIKHSNNPYIVSNAHFDWAYQHKNSRPESFLDAPKAVVRAFNDSTSNVYDLVEARTLTKEEKAMASVALTFSDLTVSKGNEKGCFEVDSKLSKEALLNDGTKKEVPLINRTPQQQKEWHAERMLLEAFAEQDQFLEENATPQSRLLNLPNTGK